MNWKKKLVCTADLELLYDFYSAIGFYNERIKLYLATDLKKWKNPRLKMQMRLRSFLRTLAEAEELDTTG